MDDLMKSRHTEMRNASLLRALVIPIHSAEALKVSKMALKKLFKTILASHLNVLKT